MVKYLSLINPILIIASGVLLTLSVHTWLKPAPTSLTDPPAVKTVSKKLEAVALKPTRYANAVMGDVVAKNLFRKQRKPYRKPISRVPAPQAVESQAVRQEPLLIPPPQFVLNGVLLTGTTKIAFMKGKYLEAAEGRKPEEVTLKRKGYEVGERIGNYRITEIQKRSVTLTGESGHIMTIRVKKHDPSKRAKVRKASSAKRGKTKGSKVRRAASVKNQNVPPLSEETQPRTPARQRVLGG